MNSGDDSGSFFFSPESVYNILQKGHQNSKKHISYLKKRPSKPHPIPKNELLTCVKGLKNLGTSACFCRCFLSPPKWGQKDTFRIFGQQNSPVVCPPTTCTSSSEGSVNCRSAMARNWGFFRALKTAVFQIRGIPKSMGFRTLILL